MAHPVILAVILTVWLFVLLSILNLLLLITNTFFAIFVMIVVHALCLERASLRYIFCN